MVEDFNAIVSLMQKSQMENQYGNIGFTWHVRPEELNIWRIYYPKQQSRYASQVYM